MAKSILLEAFSVKLKNKNMASINLIEAFQDFKDPENIDRPTLMRVVEDVFRTLIRKKIRKRRNF
jgi:N utilization substance protein A